MIIRDICGSFITCLALWKANMLNFIIIIKVRGRCHYCPILQMRWLVSRKMKVIDIKKDEGTCSESTAGPWWGKNLIHPSPVTLYMVHGSPVPVSPGIFCKMQNPGPSQTCRTWGQGPGNQHFIQSSRMILILPEVWEFCCHSVGRDPDTFTRKYSVWLPRSFDLENRNERKEISDTLSQSQEGCKRCEMKRHFDA